MGIRWRMAIAGIGVLLTPVLPSSPVRAAMLNQSSGTWGNVVSDGDARTEFFLIDQESQIRWGRPEAGGTRSGLGFTGITNLPITLNTPFSVGTLRHFNNPVFPPSVRAVDLQLRLSLAGLGATLLDRQFTFTFAIDETPNRPPCVYSSILPCADKITFSNTFASEAFNLNGTAYTLKLLGFSDSPTSPGAVVNQFISQERTTNVAYLYGELTAAPPPPVSVPEPGAIAAIVLLGGYLVCKHHRG